MGGEVTNTFVCANESEHNPRNCVSIDADWGSCQKTAVLWLRTLVLVLVLRTTRVLPPAYQKTASFPFIICTGYSLYVHYSWGARLFIISVPMGTVALDYSSHKK